MRNLGPMDMGSASTEKIDIKLDHLLDFVAIVVKIFSDSSPFINAAAGKSNSGRVPIKLKKLKPDKLVFSSFLF